MTTSRFFFSPAKDVPVIGGLYRHSLTSSVYETAEILAVSSDRSGIPHVRFRRHIHRPAQRPVLEGERTLSLAAFRDNFIEVELAHG